MVNRTPLKFEFDSATPSSLAEFTSSDVVPVINGGTGVSSLALLGASLSGIDLSSTWVSATNITATNVSATSVSSTYIYAENGVSSASVSATDLKGRSITAGVDVISRVVSGTYLVAGDSVSSTSVSSNYLIAGVAVSSTAVSANYLISNKQTSSTTASSTYLIAESGVSSASVSATAITGADAMPFPAPFGYVQCDDDGTDSTTEINFGIGATITNIVSNSDDITWNDTTKVFNVLKAGTYEVFANCVLDVGTQSDLIDMDILKNGSRVMAISPRCFGNHGPFTRTILGVTTAAASDTITVSLDPQTGGKSVTLKIGSTMTVKRLK